MKKLIKVIYACTISGNRHAPAMDCTEKGEYHCDSLTEALKFANSCTLVYNLDEIINAVSPELVPDAAEEVLMRENFNANNGIS